MNADHHQRLQAIDVTTSCIVQAPAGSGKTELLIQRLLALLAAVDKPQQILAITFTNKAAAEMRQRLLEALAFAASDPEPQSHHAAQTWQLARQALMRHGDSLLRNPAQLAIQTIDSFCAMLVRKMPWTTRFGGMPEVAEDTEQLYGRAVEQLFSGLGQDDAVGAALTVVLKHLDNDMAVVEKMLSSLLARRDQWLRHLPVAGEELLNHLNSTLGLICSEQLLRTKRLIPAELETELIDCAAFAAANSETDSAIHCWCDCHNLPEATMNDIPLWLGLTELLLTGVGELRKTVNKNNGFPAGSEGKEKKERMLALLRNLQEHPALVNQLRQVKDLPPGYYNPQQWQLLQALFVLLPQLVAQLWLVFRKTGSTDFIEIALRANLALGAADDPSDLLLKLDHQLRHILVDEFQDTSRMQYQLFSTLTAGWEPGDGRTLFLVGDPMQSIYRFREADVGLFLHSFNGTFGTGDLPVKPLRLSCNFRSQQGIVDWVNQTFAAVFPEQMEVTTGAVPLSRAEAFHPPRAGVACEVHPFAGVDDQAEAQQVVEIIQRSRAEDATQDIAILVRGRNHLRQILPLLRQHNIDYQAQDIDRLQARPSALDIVHLSRALVHRGDRLAWTAVLRAPWCGLNLNDLYALEAAHMNRTIPSLLDDMVMRTTLSEDGQRRLDRVWPILKQALRLRGQRPLRTLVEACWVALGGSVGLSTAALRDADQIFALLEDLDQGGDLPDLDALQRRLQKLFAAPDSNASGSLQIMTIHKAKGLQFDTVILPGLGKGTQSGDSPLLRWLEHPQYGLLLAPVTERGSQKKDPIYQLVSRIENQKEAHESGRLLYVATTRAVRKLHLLGHATPNSAGDLCPAKGSLLEKLWPQAEHDFIERAVSVPPVTQQRSEPKLYRLSPDWVLPACSAVIFPSSQQQSSLAVSKETIFESLYSGWESSLQRHVGTMIHQLLERIARSGSVVVWSTLSVDERDDVLRKGLRALGVRRDELELAVTKVVTAMEKTLASKRGQWLLSAHPQQAAEMPLTGQIDSQIVHRVIDRTFVAQGVRWVIDYKTSSPAPEEDDDMFLRREGEHYHQQLQVYVQLMQKLDQDNPVKGAFYFPVIDGWYEHRD